jgi:16S rRNA (cytidine1402-2'-O)-methyltransferase
MPNLSRDHGVVVRILDRGRARSYRGGVNGTLFVVPTPLGDPADLSPRARAVLASVDRVAAEDTRSALRLFREIGVTPPKLVSCHDHNEAERAAELVGRILGGERIALVSDAGTPLISDPGYRVLVEAIAAGVEIVVLPGPCAAVAALSGAGLPSDRFLFLGFLPRDEGPRAAVLRERRFEPSTVIVYEAPHRILETLRAIRAAWGERRVALVQDLTKTWERWRRGTVGEVEAELAALDEVRGEMTLVIEGFSGRPDAADVERLDALIDALVAAGVPVGTVRDVVASVYDRPRREIYQRALEARRTESDDP